MTYEEIKIHQKFDELLSKAEKITDKLNFSIAISRDEDNQLIVDILARKGNEVANLATLHPLLAMFGRSKTLKQFFEDKI